MFPRQNQSAKFRAALKNELPLWVEHGVISEAEARRLSDAYQLEALRAESSRLLSAVIFTVGGLLLGGGLLSLVAANWDELSRPLKLTILFAALLGFHTSGYLLWQRAGWRRLGEALLFAGCLVFGANIGLIAQTYNISGDWYGAFGAWAVGSLAVAWALRSWVIGLLALFTSFIWFTGFHNDGYDNISFLYPLAVAGTVLPLAMAAHSRVLNVGGWLGILIAVCVFAGDDGSAKQLLLAMTAAGLLVWAVGNLHRLYGWRQELANSTAALGLTTLATGAYFLSLHAVWEEAQARQLRVVFCLTLLALALAAAIAVLLRARATAQRLAFGVLAVAVLLCGSVLLALDATRLDVLFTIIANLAALLLAAIIIAIGIGEERRVPFWLGSVYVVLLVLSRFLEYETSLLLKAAAFLGCGIAVILAGIRYETYLRRQDPPPPVSQTSPTEVAL